MSQLFFLPGDESFIMALGRGSAVGWRDEVAVGFEEVNQEWMANSLADSTHAGLVTQVYCKYVTGKET